MGVTDELRRMLDERGVEHYDGTEVTLWMKDKHGYRASGGELTDGRFSLHLWCTTPEQAIEATLKRGECHIEHYDTDMFDGERYYRCSACHSERIEWGDKYCPNCGAKAVSA